MNRKEDNEHALTPKELNMNSLVINAYSCSTPSELVYFFTCFSIHVQLFQSYGKDVFIYFTFLNQFKHEKYRCYQSRSRRVNLPR
jgi:hypothetical protein